MLPKTATEEDLVRLFSPFGKIEEAAILRQGGVSRGCGFVRYAERDEAEKAIAALNGGRTMEGAPQPLTVRFADTEKAKLQRQQQRLGIPGMPFVGVPFGAYGAAGFNPATLAAGAVGFGLPGMGMGTMQAVPALGGGASARGMAMSAVPAAAQAGPAPFGAAGARHEGTPRMLELT
jgi:hypothetical protein